MYTAGAEHLVIALTKWSGHGHNHGNSVIELYRMNVVT